MITTTNKIMQVASGRGLPETLPDQTPVWVVYKREGFEQVGMARCLRYISEKTVCGELTVRQEYAGGDYCVFFEMVDDTYVTVIVLQRTVKHDRKFRW